MCETWAHISFLGPGNILWPQKKRNKKAVREGDRERERAPQTFDFAKSWQRYAQKCQAERDRWRHRQDRGGKGRWQGAGARGERGTWTSGGLGQSNSQTAAEMYNKSRRQRATSTKNATLRIRSGAPPKKPNNRTKPRTLYPIPPTLPSLLFLSHSLPSSHSLTRCHCEVSPYPHIRCSTASNEISNVAEIRFFLHFRIPCS